MSFRCLLDVVSYKCLSDECSTNSVIQQSIRTTQMSRFCVLFVVGLFSLIVPPVQSQFSSDRVPFDSIFFSLQQKLESSVPRPSGIVRFWSLLERHPRLAMPTIVWMHRQTCSTMSTEHSTLRTRPTIECNDSPMDQSMEQLCPDSTFRVQRLCSLPTQVSSTFWICWTIESSDGSMVCKRLSLGDVVQDRRWTKSQRAMAFLSMKISTFTFQNILIIEFHFGQRATQPSDVW